MHLVPATSRQGSRNVPQLSGTDSPDDPPSQTASQVPSRTRQTTHEAFPFQTASQLPSRTRQKTPPFRPPANYLHGLARLTGTRADWRALLKFSTQIYLGDFPVPASQLPSRTRQTTHEALLSQTASQLPSRTRQTIPPLRQPAKYLHGFASSEPARQTDPGSGHEKFLTGPAHTFSNTHFLCIFTAHFFCTAGQPSANIQAQDGAFAEGGAEGARRIIFDVENISEHENAAVTRGGRTQELYAFFAHQS